MSIERILRENESSILGMWIDEALGTYSPDSVRVFKTRKDRFSNPIGYTIKHCLERLYRYLCGDMEKEVLMPDIENLVKLRAVQNFSPSKSIAFFISIKEHAWEACRREMTVEDLLAEWRPFEAKVDGIALGVFDMYMHSRELLHQIRVNEVLRGTHSLTDGTKCGAAVLAGSIGDSSYSG